MQTRSWDAADGTKKYRTEIVADNVQFGPKVGGYSGGAGNSGQASEGSPIKAEGLNKSENIDTIEYPKGIINPEDIPF